MHQYLVQDCAGKGGCCGRDCGCCINRPADLDTRKLGVGHCTVECGCCNKARGFELTEDEKKAYDKRFNFSRENPLGHYERASLQVLLFGILETKEINPFDLIYEPPQREYKPPHWEDNCVSVITSTPCKSLQIAETECKEWSEPEVSTGEIISLDDV
jgi:hypothetical protein